MPRRGAERGILRRAHRQRYGRRIRKDPVKARVAIPAADPPGNLHRCHFPAACLVVRAAFCVAFNEQVSPFHAFPFPN
jgi:hypothetical protein